MSLCAAGSLNIRVLLTEQKDGDSDRDGLKGTGEGTISGAFLFFLPEGVNLWVDLRSGYISRDIGGGRA